MCILSLQGQNISSSLLHIHFPTAQVFNKSIWHWTKLSCHSWLNGASFSHPANVHMCTSSDFIFVYSSTASVFSSVSSSHHELLFFFNSPLACTGSSIQAIFLFIFELSSSHAVYDIQISYRYLTSSQYFLHCSSQQTGQNTCQLFPWTKPALLSQSVCSHPDMESSSPYLNLPIHAALLADQIDI